MLQERQHRWTEIEELCTFTIVTDSLYANMPKKSRRSSLQRALADVASLTLSAPVSGTINEDVMGEMMESASSTTNLNRSTFDVNRKASRDDSFDNSSGASSSVGSSRQASIISNVSSTSAIPEATAGSDTVSLKEKSNEQTTHSPKQQKANRNGTTTTTRMRRVSSDKFGHSVSLTENSSTVSSRPADKKLHRVNTEPLGISRRAMTNALNNGRHRNSGEFNHNHRHSTHSVKAASSRDRLSDGAGKMFTTQSEEDVSGNNLTGAKETTSNLSLENLDDNDKYDNDEDLDDFEEDDDDDGISIQTSVTTMDNGQLSDDSSMTSSASVTSTSTTTSSKKKKKGIHGLKKIFHRKQKEDR